MQISGERHLNQGEVSEENLIYFSENQRTV